MAERPNLKIVRAQSLADLTTIRADAERAALSRWRWERRQRVLWFMVGLLAGVGGTLAVLVLGRGAGFWT